MGELTPWERAAQLRASRVETEPTASAATTASEASVPASAAIAPSRLRAVLRRKPHPARQARWGVAVAATATFAALLPAMGPLSAGGEQHDADPEPDEAATPSPENSMPESVVDAAVDLDVAATSTTTTALDSVDAAPGGAAPVVLSVDVPTNAPAAEPGSAAASASVAPPQSASAVAAPTPTDVQPSSGAAAAPPAATPVTTPAPVVTSPTSPTPPVTSPPTTAPPPVTTQPPAPTTLPPPPVTTAS